MSATAYPPAPNAAKPRADGFDIRHPTLTMVVAWIFGSLLVGAAATQGLVAGVGALVVVTASVLILRHPALGALALVALVPALSGLKRGVPVPGLRPAEFLIAGVATLIIATAGRRAWRDWGPFDWAAMGYFAIALVFGTTNTLMRGDSLSFDDIGQMLGPLQFFLLYRAVLIALPRKEQRSKALNLLLGASIPVSILTLMQVANVPGIQSLLVGLTGEDFSDRLQWTVIRANGPFPHWTSLGGYMMAMVLVSVALLLNGVLGRRRILVLIALGLAAASCVTTLTLWAIGGAIVGSLILARTFNRTGTGLAWLAGGAVVLVVLFAPMLSERADDQFAGSQTSSGREYSVVPTSVANRVDIWTQEYIPALEGRWLTGYGPQVPPDVAWQYTESVYITVLLRGGLPLFAVYFALMWAAVVIGRRAARVPDEPDARVFGRVLSLLVWVLAVVQVIVPLFTLTGFPHVFWILAALGSAAVAHMPARVSAREQRARMFDGVPAAHPGVAEDALVAATPTGIRRTHA